MCRTRSGVWEPYQEFFDQETVVEDNNAFGSQGSGLLIREIGIVDRRQADLIAFAEHSPQLLARYRRASRYDQSCVTQVDEADLTTFLDAPPPTQLCRKAGLASMGNLGVRRGVHGCIVALPALQGVRSGAQGGRTAGSRERRLRITLCDAD